MPTAQYGTAGLEEDVWCNAGEVDADWQARLPARAETRFRRAHSEWLHDSGWDVAQHPKLQDLLSELRLVCEESAADEGRSDGVVPVPREACDRAERLLRALPAQLEAPDILAHPSGHIALEWLRHKRWVFTLAIGSEDVLYFAGLFGKSKVTGREDFDGVSIPIPIIQHVERLYSSVEVRG